MEGKFTRVQRQGDCFNENFFTIHSSRIHIPNKKLAISSLQQQNNGVEIWIYENTDGIQGIIAFVNTETTYKSAQIDQSLKPSQLRVLLFIFEENASSADIQEGGIGLLLWIWKKKKLSEFKYPFLKKIQALDHL